jgi:hypothetical protein
LTASSSSCSPSYASYSGRAGLVRVPVDRAVQHRLPERQHVPPVTSAGGSSDDGVGDRVARRPCRATPHPVPCPGKAAPAVAVEPLRDQRCAAAGRRGSRVGFYSSWITCSRSWWRRSAPGWSRRCSCRRGWSNRSSSEVGSSSTSCSIQNSRAARPCQRCGRCLKRRRRSTAREETPQRRRREPCPPVAATTPMSGSPDPAPVELSKRSFVALWGP